MQQSAILSNFFKIDRYRVHLNNLFKMVHVIYKRALHVAASLPLCFAHIKQKIQKFTSYSYLFQPVGIYQRLVLFKKLSKKKQVFFKSNLGGGHLLGHGCIL